MVLTSSHFSWAVSATHSGLGQQLKQGLSSCLLVCAAAVDYRKNMLAPPRLTDCFFCLCVRLHSPTRNCDRISLCCDINLFSWQQLSLRGYTLALKLVSNQLTTYGDKRKEGFLVIFRWIQLHQNSAFECFNHKQVATVVCSVLVYKHSAFHYLSCNETWKTWTSR